MATTAAILAAVACSMSSGAGGGLARWPSSFSAAGGKAKR
jgi:hypothetical protein